MTTATGHAIGVQDRIYIGGEWVKSTGTGAIEVINSTTEQVMGSVPEGTVEDVDSAVAAARVGVRELVTDLRAGARRLDAAHRRGARLRAWRRSRS